MKKFIIDDYTFDYKDPRSVIEALCSLQGIDYEYEAFLNVLKRRLRLFTCDEKVTFYDEEKIVDLLVELEEITILDS